VVDPVKAISRREKRARQFERWTEDLCISQNLNAFTDVIFGVRYSFRDPSELLHGLVKLGVVQYRRYFDLNADSTRLGVFISPNLGHRAVYFLYKRQHEELIYPEEPVEHEAAMLNAKHGMNLYHYEVEARMGYEIVEKGRKKRKRVIWDFYNKEENTAVEVETGSNNSAQVAQHVRAALHTGVNLIIVIPRWNTLRLLNYYTQCVFRGLSKARRLPQIRIELRDIRRPKEVLRWIEVSNKPRLKTNPVPERFYTEKEKKEEFYNPTTERYEWRTKKVKILRRIELYFPREVRVRESSVFSKEELREDLIEKFPTRRKPEV
jgi:hypothetical protein